MTSADELPPLRTVRICLKKLPDDLEELEEHFVNVFCGQRLYVGQSLRITKGLKGKVSSLVRMSSPNDGGACSASATADDTFTSQGVLLEGTHVYFELPAPPALPAFPTRMAGSTLSDRIQKTIISTGKWMAKNMPDGITSLLLVGSDAELMAELACCISLSSGVKQRHFISLDDFDAVFPKIQLAESACVVITKMEFIVLHTELLLLFKQQPQPACKIFLVCTTNNNDLLCGLGMKFTKILHVKGGLGKHSGLYSESNI